MANATGASDINAYYVSRAEDKLILQKIASDIFLYRLWDYLRRFKLFRNVR